MKLISEVTENEWQEFCKHVKQMREAQHNWYLVRSDYWSARYNVECCHIDHFLKQLYL